MDEFTVPKYGVIERSWKSRLRKRWAKPKKDNVVPKEIVWLKNPQFGDKYVLDRIVLKCHNTRQILLLSFQTTTWAIEERNGNTSIRAFQNGKPFNASNDENVRFIDKKIRKKLSTLPFSELNESVCPKRIALESDAYLFYSPEILKRDPPDLTNNWALRERK